MFQTKFVQKVKTHIYVQQRFSEHDAVYENVENVVEPDRPQTTI